jgi:hypothetical protein
MDEEKNAMSGPKARKAVMFQRAVLKNRRSEQAVRREPDGAFDQRSRSGDKSVADSEVRAQQRKIRAAFGDAA